MFYNAGFNVLNKHSLDIVLDKLENQMLEDKFKNQMLEDKISKNLEKNIKSTTAINVT